MTGQNNTGKTYLAYSIYGLYYCVKTYPFQLDFGAHDFKLENDQFNILHVLDSYTLAIEESIAKVVGFQLGEIFGTDKLNFKDTVVQLKIVDSDYSDIYNSY